MAIQMSFTNKGATHGLGYHRVREVSIRNYANGKEAFITLDSYANHAAKATDIDRNVLETKSFRVFDAQEEGQPKHFTDYFKSVPGVGDPTNSYDLASKKSYKYLKEKCGYGEAEDV